MDDSAWIRAEISLGLARLLVLRLPGYPPEDMITQTAMVWVEAILDAPMGWDEALDRPRIRRAFTTLTRTCDRWPAPKTLLDHLPPRPELPKLPEPKMSEEVVARQCAGIQRLVKELAGRLESDQTNR